MSPEEFADKYKLVIKNIEKLSVHPEPEKYQCNLVLNDRAIGLIMAVYPKMDETIRHLFIEWLVANGSLMPNVDKRDKIIRFLGCAFEDFNQLVFESRPPIRDPDYLAFKSRQLMRDI